MTELPRPLDLLRCAAQVMSASLHGISQFAPTRPTPCTEWDLGTLVLHVADSAAVLTGLISGGAPSPGTQGACAQAQFELQRLLRAVRRPARGRPEDELGAPALAGAFELTLHAWDINEATGRHAPLPADLVGVLLTLAPVVLAGVEREGLFGPGYPPSDGQRTDTDRLLAMFGRKRRSPRAEPIDSGSHPGLYP